MGNGNTRTAAGLVLGISGKWKRYPFWGTQFGFGQGNPGWKSVPYTIPQTTQCGATARGDHRQHKVSGPCTRAASPQSFHRLDPSLQANIFSNSLQPLNTMTTASHNKQPGLFPERQEDGLYCFSLGEPIWCSNFHLRGQGGGFGSRGHRT